MIKGVAAIKKSILGSISLDFSQLSEFIKEFGIPILIFFLVLIIVVLIVFLIAVYLIILIVYQIGYTVRSVVRMLCLSWNNSSKLKCIRLNEMKNNNELVDDIQKEVEEEKYLEQIDSLLGPSPGKLLSFKEYFPHPIRFIKKLILNKENSSQKKDGK